MDVNSVLASDPIIVELLLSHLHNSWKDLDDDGFVIKCVDIISRTIPSKAAIVKSTIKSRYPLQWIRIEKLLALK